MIPDAFYVPDGDRFRGTEHTRGPWSADHQHGGPPSALLARAFEHLVADAGMEVVRVTVDLLSPVPIAPLQITAAITRASRKVQRLDGTLAADGKIVCRATGLAIQVAHTEDTNPPEPLDLPVPEASTPFVFPFFPKGVSYAAAVEQRLARGVWGKGDAALWMRTRIPLIPRETPSPLQRVMIAADSGSGVAVVVDAMQSTFINADVDVALHRPPAGDWVCVDARTTLGAHGIGLTTSRLLDERGAIGLAHQSLVITPR